jgi:hypothetical protein
MKSVKDFSFRLKKQTLLPFLADEKKHKNGERKGERK